MRTGTIITHSRIFHDRQKTPMLDGVPVGVLRLSELRTKMRARGFKVDGTALKNALVEIYEREFRDQSDSRRLDGRKAHGKVDLDG